METNRYAAQNPTGDRYKCYDTSVDEIKIFLRLIIAMGLHQLSAYTDYWSSDNLLWVPGFVSGMLLDRFKVLLKCLHLNDNTTCILRGDPGYDRLHKVRPLLTQVTNIFSREYIPNRNIGVDEAMIGFKGKSSIKQYMPMKATKWGYKVWSLCDSHNGYLCKFKVYTGANTGSVTNRRVGGSSCKKTNHSIPRK